MQGAGVGEAPTTGIVIGTVRVVTEVICPQGFVCPAPSDFIYAAGERGPPGNLIRVDPKFLRGASEGVPVQFVFGKDPGLFLITQTTPPTPKGLTLTTTESPECLAELHNAQTVRCVFTNEYKVAPTT